MYLLISERNEDPQTQRVVARTVSILAARHVAATVNDNVRLLLYREVDGVKGPFDRFIGVGAHAHAE